MKTRVGTQSLLIAGLLGMAFALPLQSATIFDNSVNDLVTQFSPGTLEVGDQIVLASTERYLTDFRFEYWGTSSGASFAGAVQARVRFYENNGPLFNGYYAPGSVFYDSGWFGGFDAINDYPGRATINFSQGTDFPDGGLFIPADEITWTIQFQGMGTGDEVGVDIYSPAVVGGDYDDYWEYNGGWTLLTNTVPMDFAAVMYANATIPEPSSLALSLLGGLGILTFARRLRRN